MKICTFLNRNGNQKVGVLKDQKIFALSNYVDMIGLIKDSYLNPIEKLMNHAEKEYDFSDVTLMAPVTNPDKMIFVGLNYKDHAIETNTPIPEYPVLFPKFKNSLLGHGEKVIIPRETAKCDYEAELAFIVGKRAKNVDIRDAMDYVFGYTICNDVSARDLQKRASQWMSGKAIDTFAPMGPYIVTADEIKDPHRLNISCRINGEQRQNSNTKELIFNIPTLVSYISKTTTLEPGDIISTGTPSGVASGMKPPAWLKEGDICECEIEGIGLLKNGFQDEV